MRIPPSFIFRSVVRFPYVVRFSRAANTSAARRGDRVGMRGRLRGQRAGAPYYDCADNGPEPRTTIARTTGQSPAPRMRGLRAGDPHQRLRGQRAGDPHHDCADYGPETRTTIARTTGRRPALRLRDYGPEPSTTNARTTGRSPVLRLRGRLQYLIYLAVGCNHWFTC
jgi:hypothetical protein